MKKKINVLGVIGIRSGSKGLKNKNILKLGNKHLVGWIIQAAKKSALINRVVVSTENPRYAKIAKKYGAEIPFLRPRYLAQDNSKEIDFIKHLIKNLQKEENYFPDIIVRLLATCPFQKTDDIDNAIRLVVSGKYDSSVIISKAKEHPMKAIKIKSKNKKKFLVSYFGDRGIDVGSRYNRQNFEKAYFRANVIVFRTNVLKKNSLTSNKPGFIIIQNKIDIDTKQDLEYAKFFISKKKNYF